MVIALSMLSCIDMASERKKALHVAFVLQVWLRHHICSKDIQNMNLYCLYCLFLC